MAQAREHALPAALTCSRSDAVQSSGKPEALQNIATPLPKFWATALDDAGSGTRPCSPLGYHDEFTNGMAELSYRAAIRHFWIGALLGLGPHVSWAWQLVYQPLHLQAHQNGEHCGGRKAGISDDGIDQGLFALRNSFQNRSFVFV